jgi:hypothetical protein
LKIRAHYGKFLAQNEAVGAALCMNSAELLQHVTRINICNVVTGTFFMHQGSLVEVVSLNDNNVLVRVDKTLDEYYISLNEAAELIESYLGYKLIKIELALDIV